MKKDVPIRVFLLRFLFSVLLFGYTVGSFSVFCIPAEKLLAYGSVYMDNLHVYPWLTAFLFGPFLSLILLFSGYSLIGWLFVLPVLFFKAFHSALLALYFYSEYAYAGILHVFAFLFFPAAISIVVLCIQGTESINFSLKIRHIPTWQWKTSLEEYTLISVVLTMLHFLSVLWTVFVNPLLKDLFVE